MNGRAMNSPVRSRTSGCGAESHSRVICVTWTLGTLGSASGEGWGENSGHRTAAMEALSAVGTFTEDS